MIYKLFLLSMMCAVSVAAWAQKRNYEDVVYLKNKWIFRGTIVHEDSLVKLQSRDGNLYLFHRAEIDSMTREKVWRIYAYAQSGFAHFTELGPLVAGKTTMNGVTTAAFSFQTVNGYKFSQFVMAGLGVGADLYATQTVLPVFASFRGDVSTKETVIPFYFADLGYGFNITQDSNSDSNFKGGLMMAAGFGLKIPFNRNAGFLLSAGYRYQGTSYVHDMVESHVIYNRVALRAGFFL